MLTMDPRLFPLIRFIARKDKAIRVDGQGIIYNIHPQRSRPQ